MLGSRQQTELAYSLMFSLPGTPVIRYGDEIGMGDDLQLPERDAVRTPMQWSAEEGGGFSKASKLVHPVIKEGFYSHKHVNVEDQRRDPSSLLNWMTSLIRLRKECPEIGWGKWQVIDTKNNQVLCMCFSWKGRSLIVLHNFSEKPYEIILTSKQVGEERLIDLMANVESRVDEIGRHSIIMDAYGYRWFRAGNLDHLF